MLTIFSACINECPIVIPTGTGSRRLAKLTSKMHFSPRGEIPIGSRLSTQERLEHLGIPFGDDECISMAGWAGFEPILAFALPHWENLKNALALVYCRSVLATRGAKP